MSDRLTRLRAMRDFITREIAAELEATTATIAADPVLPAVARLYNVPIVCLLDHGDRRHVVTRARHAAVYMLHRQGHAPSDICATFGYADAHAIHAAMRRVERDAGMRALLHGLEATA